MKTAIFQIFIGQPHEGYKLCINSVKSYSQGKADYFISNKTRINGPSVYFEKLQCLDLLDHYDRVLLIDCDILVTPKAENIFEKYPEDFLFAFNENSDDEWMQRESWIDTYSPDFDWPVYNGRKQYFNTGCVLLNKSHRNILNLMAQMKFTHKNFSIDSSEQTPLNYVVSKHKIPFKSLDYSFNRMDLGKNDPTNERYKANFIHYAGPCRYGNGNKKEAMELDYKNLYGN